MIVGIGIDLVEIERIDEALARHGDRFAKRILSDSEFAEWDALSGAMRSRFLAKRFAAKEAFSKAAGTGIGRGFGFQDLSVSHDALGKPLMSLNTGCAALVRYDAHHIHLSLTDERAMAGAFCVIEQPARS